MSNIAGSVDLVREKERQARQQLLDEFRDPSPQPIFSQPVKVELEDETSRRIKDTLGDFSQLQHVLINDPKHLIGISRSGAVAAANNVAATAASRSSVAIDHGGVGSATWSAKIHGTSNGLIRSAGNSSSRHHNVAKKPHQQINGLHKSDISPMGNSRRLHVGASNKSGASVERKHQHGPSKHKSDHPPKINPISKGYATAVGHLDQQPLLPGDSGNSSSNQDRTSSKHPHLHTETPVISDKNHDSIVHHHRRTNNSVGNSNVTVNGDNKLTASDSGSTSSSIPNGIIKSHKSQRSSDRTVQKHHIHNGDKNSMHPPKLSIPTLETKKPDMEVETILREMKQAVPPPLTGIQTPRTEENGFIFSSEPDKDFSRVLDNDVRTLNHHSVGSGLTPLSPERSSRKSPYRSSSPFNLQEDLEMSESDDEGNNMVPACKSIRTSQVNSYAKCPPVNRDENSGLSGDRVNSHGPTESQSHSKKAASNGSNSNSGPILSVHSSSSESSDSDSEDSCSESNDSDSSASSEASDKETPAKPAPQMWNLSNFFDETKKNHSPAFMAMDTNTNSNISTAVREEHAPASVPSQDKDVFSLADGDCLLDKYAASVNCLLDRDVKDYMESPGNENRDSFNIESGSAGYRDKRLEHQSSLSPPRIIAPRGPRTPPSPPAKDDSEDDEEPFIKQATIEPRKPIKPEIISEIKSESSHSKSVRTIEHHSHRSRSERHTSGGRSKKKSSSKSKDIASPVVPKADSNHKNNIVDKCFSASKEKALDENKHSNSLNPGMTSSLCSVPSTTTSTHKSTHRSPAKSHHRHNSPATTISLSSRSSPKKRSSHESKDLNKTEQNLSKSKSSAKIKPSSNELESGRSRSSSRNKSEKYSSTANTPPVSSKHSKQHKVKSKHSSSKTKSHVDSKPAENIMSPSTSPTKKAKTKSSKNSVFQEIDKKKADKKKKFSKFSIKNFLQSPSSSPNQSSYKPTDISEPVSPIGVSDPEDLPPSPVHSRLSESPLRVPVTDADAKDLSDHSQNVFQSKTRKHRKCSVSSSSRSRSRSNSENRMSSTEKNKIKKQMSKNRKRRASRSSNSDFSNSNRTRRHREARQTRRTLQSSSSSVSPQNSRHSSPASPSCELDLPTHPPELLSPIPSCEKSNSAINFPSSPPSPLPNIIMVSIELNKLLRIPDGHRNSSPPVLKPPKDHFEDSLPPRLTSAMSPPEPLDVALGCVERSFTSSMSPCKKEIKTKSRTETYKSNKSDSDQKSIEKLSKPTHSESSNSHKTSSSSISTNSSRDKTSIKNTDSNSKSKNNHESSSAKKRKPDEPVPDTSKKKTKMNNSVSSPGIDDFKEKTLVVKVEKLDMSTFDRKSASKGLERCDSASSLSSLCSQVSHKSSKSLKEKPKDVPKETQDCKKPKNTLPVTKELKKEEKPKVATKKEKEINSNVKNEKPKLKTKERPSVKGPSSNSENKKAPETFWGDGHSASSQVSYREDTCKIEETKPQPTNHQRNAHGEVNSASDWEHSAPDAQRVHKTVPNHLNKVNAPSQADYYWQEGRKFKALAEKEKNPVIQCLNYFDATVMFILTSLHKELSNKDPESVFGIYKDTLKFTSAIRNSTQKRLSHSTSGNIDYKLLILCLKCQSLLHLKLYNLKIKEVKERHKDVSEFMHSSSSKLGSHCSPMSSCSTQSKTMSQPSPCQPRIGGGGANSVPSPHSPTPSPAGSVASVGSQSSGYSSSEVNGNHSRPHNTNSLLQLPQHMPQLGAVSVPQNMFDVMAKHHSHLSNLHLCHELWEQADMYMTRSNSKEFFKEVADKSETKLSLHSNIKELVSYLKTGLALLRSSYC